MAEGHCAGESLITFKGGVTPAKCLSERPLIKRLIKYIYPLVILTAIYISFCIAKIALAPEIAQGQVIQEKDLGTEVHRLAQKYSQDETLIRRIIKCESAKSPNEIQGITNPLLVDGKTYHIVLNSKGENKINGKVWSTDWGVLQINDYYHKEKMEEMGLNIYNWAEGLEYGIVLLKEQGTRHWNASKLCWQKNLQLK